MNAAAIIKELEKMPVKDKLFVIERTLKSLRQKSDDIYPEAVDALYNDYKNDEELTVFSTLDKEPFYEAR